MHVFLYFAPQSNMTRPLPGLCVCAIRDCVANSIFLQFRPTRRLAVVELYLHKGSYLNATVNKLTSSQPSSFAWQAKTAVAPW